MASHGRAGASRPITADMAGASRPYDPFIRNETVVCDGGLTIVEIREIAYHPAASDPGKESSRTMGVRLDQIEPRNVCLIKPSSLGDVVHALPVLAALKGRWPGARFAWVVNSGLRGLVEGHPDLDEVIPFDRKGVGLSPRGLARLAGFLMGLRRRRFDLVVDLQGLLRSGLMTRASGARWRVGMAEAREGAPHFYSHAVVTGGTKLHAVDRLMRVASAFGAGESEPRFHATISDDDHRWAAEVLADVPRPRLVLNVGARWLTKRWPPAHFAEVARRAAIERAAGLVAVGAPEDRPLVDELLAALAPLPCLDLCGKTSLPRLAAIAARSDCFLSNDTGPLHLAAAAGARVVGVYTCTDPARTGPYGPNATVVRSGVWCAPSFVKACSRLECMAELSPGRVWAAVGKQPGWGPEDDPQMTQICADKM